jgi:hypothetical protein
MLKNFINKTLNIIFKLFLLLKFTLTKECKVPNIQEERQVFIGRQFSSLDIG